MALYAHAVIELEDARYERGDEVPEDALSAEEIAELAEGGAVSEDPYDPEVDKVGPPATVVIDGVTYTKETDDDA
jgi:hypothetical protein